MRTEVLTVDPVAPDPEAIDRAADVLRRGGLVAFPTETVYGLGAAALDADAVLRIFDAKGRPANNPVIVHTADAARARELVSDWPEGAEQLSQRFWPGPLTLVLPRRPIVPDVVTAGGPTVALRVPAHLVALALLRTAGVPVAAPSANRSGLLSPTMAEHVLLGLDGRIGLLLDGGPTTGGVESTVLDLASTPPRLLRPGLVSASQIEAILGPIDRPPVAAVTAEALPSPGMLARHYAPRTPLECVTNGRNLVHELLTAGQRVGWLTFDKQSLDAPGPIVHEMPLDARAYAAVLYAILHALDRAGLDRIIVDEPPRSEEWLAIHDRLHRASASGR